VLGLALGLELGSVLRFIVRFRHFQVQKIRRSARPHVHILPVAKVRNESMRNVTGMNSY